MSDARVVLLLAVSLLAAGCVGEPLEPNAGPSEDTNTSEDGAEASPNGTSSDDAETDDEDASDDGGNRTDDPDGAEGNETQPDNGTDDRDEETDPGWPAPEEASIRPGVRITQDGTCTSNFLFRTPDNATLMLGTAAHCVAETPSVGTDGCADDVDPMQPGAEVPIAGASQPGRLVYSSFHTMQQIGTNETATCSGNDLALVAIHPADRPDVHPAVQGFGGPTGLASPSDVGLGDRVEWYGNTALTPSSEATNRHEGSVVTSTEWDFQAYSATPGMPGDSGSGIMLADGQAAGILYAVNTFYPGANSITHLQPALAFAEENADVDVELVTGPHTGSLP